MEQDTMHYEPPRRPQLFGPRGFSLPKVSSPGSLQVCFADQKRNPAEPWLATIPICPTKAAMLFPTPNECCDSRCP